VGVVGHDGLDRGAAAEGDLVRAGDEVDRGPLGADDLAGDLVGAAVAVEVAQVHGDAGGHEQGLDGGRSCPHLLGQGVVVSALLIVEGEQGLIAGAVGIDFAGQGDRGAEVAIGAARVDHGADLVVDGLVGVTGRNGLLIAAAGPGVLGGGFQVALLEAVGVGVIVLVDDGVALGENALGQLIIGVVGGIGLEIVRLVVARDVDLVGIDARADDVAADVELVVADEFVGVGHVGLGDGVGVGVTRWGLIGVGDRSARGHAGRIG